VDFALGEGRWPNITSGLGAAAAKLDSVDGVSAAQSRVLDAFVGQLIETSNFQDLCADALEAAESVGTACVAFAACDGVLRGEQIEAEHCTAEFDANGAVVLLVIEYPFVAEKREHGQTRSVCMLYRRVIDAERDTAFAPVEVRDGLEPAFSEVESVVEHGLGFCPVVWYAHKRKSRKAGDVDGCALHASVLDELDALNFTLSQRHRAALYSGDPQMVETGVSRDENVAPTGREPVAGMKELRDASGRTYTGFGYAERPRNARRKGAGIVWRYESPDAKVTMLTLPGDALSAIDKHAHDLDDRISQALGYTKASPETIKGALSGKALGFLYARTTAHCDRLRQDLWDGFMRPALSMLLRMAHVIDAASPGSLYVPGIGKARKVLARFARTDAAGAMRWMPPRLTPTWGRYFEQSAEDDLAEVRLAKEAFAAGLVTRELAIERLRGVFAFDSAAELAAVLDAGKDAPTGEPAPAIGKGDDSESDESDDEADDGEESDES
jgi:hypothetical protein